MQLARLLDYEQTLAAVAALPVPAVGVWSVLARRRGMHSLVMVLLMAGERALGAWTIGSTAGHVFDGYDKALATALAERASAAVQNARLFRRGRRATEARDRVLSIVSHDLRNPLSGVSMLGRRLAEEAMSESKRQSVGSTFSSLSIGCTG